MPRINLNTTFAQQVISAAQAGCSSVEVGAIIDAEQACDPAFWTSSTTTEHKQAGRVVSEAVDQGLLPLDKRGKRYDNGYSWRTKAMT